MKGLRVVALMLCVVLLAWAGEPWDKEYKSWSQEEAKKILFDSPWGKDVVTKMGFEKQSEENKQTGGKKTASATERGEMRPEEFAKVSWWSARTPRRAYLRMFELSGRQVTPEQMRDFAETTKDTYEVALWESDRVKKQVKDFKPEDYIKAAWLESQRLKQKIAPVDVEVVRDSKGMVERIIFKFPREVEGQPLVTSADKKIVFKWKLPREDKETVEKAKQFEAQFQPAKMTALGQADL